MSETSLALLKDVIIKMQVTYREANGESKWEWKLGKGIFGL